MPAERSSERSAATAPATPRRELAGAVAAEVVGTFLLVFLGAGTVLATATLLPSDAPLDAVAISLAFGFAVLVAVYTLGHVSGAHINPSVTLGLAVVGRFPWRVVPLYLAAQLAGALLASLAHWAIFGDDARETLALGATLPGERGEGPALLAEALVTFLLVVAVMGTAIDDRSPGPGITGLAVGLLVAGAIFATLPISGGSLNAARTFGPMLVAGEFDGWWVYLVGPAAGGIAGALVYELALARGSPPGAGRQQR